MCVQVNSIASTAIGYQHKEQLAMIRHLAVIHNSMHGRTQGDTRHTQEPHKDIVDITQESYHIAGNIGGELNLADWWFGKKTAK